MKISAATLLLCASSAVLLCTVSALGQTATATATAVYTFTGTDSNLPTSIIQASDGNLWGTTAEGNTADEDFGTIFKLAPDGTFTTVYTFSDSGNNGEGPVSLIEGNDGNFYGVTSGGGPYQTTCDCGTFFRITPQGQFTMLFALTQGYSENPNPGLLQGTDGNFYISTPYGPVVVSPAGTPLAFNEVTTRRIITSGMMQHTNGLFYGASASYGLVYSYTLQHVLNVYDESPGIGLGFTFAEGSDGDIYGAGNDLAFRFTTGGAYKTFATSFNAGTGLTPASDGNVYGMEQTTPLLFNITPAGQVNAIPTTGAPPYYAPDTTVTPIQASDGSFLIPFADYGDQSPTNAIYRYTLTPALPAPIQLTPSESTITLGSSFTLNWQVLNATSATLRQCNAFLSRPGTGGGDWSGLQTGSIASGVYSGSATLTPTAGGSYIYDLTCGGVESGYATVTVTGGTASATTTVLQSSLSTVPAGSPVTLTATVTANTGGYLPTGTVTFRYGSYVLATASVNSHGIAAYTASAGTTSHLAGGNYSITAHYNGDANDTASTSAPITVTVQGITAVALVISPPTFTVGGSATLTATVRDTNGGPVPTGTVAFGYEMDGDYYSLAANATLNSSGVATATTYTSQSQAPPAGSYPVTAIYSGDTLNQATTSPVVTLYVTTPTTAALTVYPASVTNGQYVTFTATITASGSTPASAGTVTFTSGSITVASAAVNSSGVASATILVKNIPAGTYPITANYQGTTIYSPSTSTPSNVTVTQ